MTTLAADEKSTLVMVYTHNMMVRGEVVTKDNARVNTWLRTDAAPRFLRLLKASVLVFGGSPVKAFNHQEYYMPLAQAIAMHLAPPLAEPMDYEEGEANRMMTQVTAHVGSFVFKGELRISAQSNVAASLDLAKMQWLSMYNLEIHNPFLPQMPPIHTNLALVSPSNVHFAEDHS